MIPISFWCLYCTKLAPISKTNDSEKAPRTGEYASNPERKNTPCFSDLAGVDFFLKKERVFFFRGSALQVFGQCGGAKCGRQSKNYFCGRKRICFASALVSKRRGFGIRRAGGCGRNARRICGFGKRKGSVDFSTEPMELCEPNLVQLGNIGALGDRRDLGEKTECVSVVFFVS